VARALAHAEPSARAETLAAKAAWPHVANGVPAHLGSYARNLIDTAAARASSLAVPTVLSEHEAQALIGASSGVAGSYRFFSVLASRGWTLLAADVHQSEHPHTASAARFARANVDLYIESVYDAHFALAKLGKDILRGYQKLGGTEAFASKLPEREVNALAAQYSEGNFRLYPHPRVHLGS